jgi:nicotinamidase-related amidase
MPAALIIVDMQQGSFTAETPRHDAEGLVGRLNELARRVRSSRGVVVYVQHDGPPGDPHHPGQTGWRLVPTLETGEEDLFVRKRYCDAFLETDLDDVLKSSGIDRVIVTGCATEFCVDTTVRSALARRYETVVPTDGHTTADRPYLAATKIIEHHNAVWADFISPAGPALLKPCARIDV